MPLSQASIVSIFDPILGIDIEADAEPLVKFCVNTPSTYNAIVWLAAVAVTVTLVPVTPLNAYEYVPLLKLGVNAPPVPLRTKLVSPLLAVNPNVG